MGKPRLIIIIRHAQSEGNMDKTVHQSTPDHKVSLTEEGHRQAREAGEKLRALLRPDDSLHFFISPYKRTRQTTEGILSTLCSDDPAPTPFPRQSIKVYEEPRLREQDFGNFQAGPEEVERIWHERAKYGHFFYRIPNGESGADVYDRVSAFNGSLWRRFDEDEMASVAVLVTHGLCSRVFLMAWYHYSVEFFEDLRNINHCEFLVMKLGNNGRYTLQNQLRRWTDLKRERAERRRTMSTSSPVQHIPVYRWADNRGEGQAPPGDKPVAPTPRRQNTADLFADDEGQDKRKTRSQRQGLSKLQTSESADSDEPVNALAPIKSIDSLVNEAAAEENSTASVVISPPQSQNQDFEDTVTAKHDSLDEVVVKSQRGSSDAKNQSLLTASIKKLGLDQSKSSRPSNKAYLGRDGGGSRSGAASPYNLSDEDDSMSTPSTTVDSGGGGAASRAVPIKVEPVTSKEIKPSSLAKALRGEFDDGDRVLADALGDHSDSEVEEADKEMGTKEKVRGEMASILAQEVRERTHRGGVY